MQTLTFRSLEEQEPGLAWQQAFEHGWPGWREWFVKRGGGDRPRMQDAERMLRRHMPEFESVWQRLVTAAGADEEAARFLTFWQPPRYLVNCSQIAVTDQDGPLLLRNYDLDPRLNESRILKTRWKHHEVMGLVEGMAGLADGMNRAGLAASLAFGGRAICGPGFGVPLIIRYVLEMCANVADALEALRAVPCHMAYNVTLADKSGAQATVMLAPDHPPIVSDKCYATNHQIGVEWPRHGRLTRTVERAAHLDVLASKKRISADALASAFLEPPLYSDRFAEGFGTVYTTAYRPADGSMALLWPGHEPWRLSFDDFSEEARRVTYQDEPASGFETAPDAPLLAAFRRRNQVLEDRSWANLNGAPDFGQEGNQS
ncbi:MAG: C45 family peptidase [Alphaproteobacteria bacterium]